jgi:hypothetical protein
MRRINAKQRCEGESTMQAEAVAQPHRLRTLAIW